MQTYKNNGLLFFLIYVKGRGARGDTLDARMPLLETVGGTPEQ